MNSNDLVDGYYNHIVKIPHAIPTGLTPLDFTYRIYEVFYRDGNIVDAFPLKLNLFESDINIEFITTGLEVVLEDIKGNSILTMEKLNEALPEEKKIRPQS